MAPAENKNKKHINDIVTGAYNSARNFCIDNKGILINYGLGIVQIVAGVKGCQYAKELNQPLLDLGSNVLWIRGVLDFGAGLSRNCANIFANSYIKDEIRSGNILPEGIKELKSTLNEGKYHQDNEFLLPEKVYPEVIREVIKSFKNYYTNNHSN